MANTIHVKLTESHKDAILVDYDENHIVPKRQSKEGADLSKKKIRFELPDLASLK